MEVNFRSVEHGTLDMFLIYQLGAACFNIMKSTFPQEF